MIRLIFFVFNFSRSTDADGDKINVSNEKDFQVMVDQSINKISVMRTGNKELITIAEEQSWSEQTDDEKFGIWM